MDTVILLLRLAVTVVFVTAGTAKLLDLQASRDTVIAFGVSVRLARVIGTVLPFAEVATAVALLPQASTRWGAVAAVALLAAFTIGVAVALAHGRTPDCNCFGQVSSEQISSRTVVRNVVLLAVAAFVAADAPGASLGRWTTNLDAANLVAAISVVLGLLAVITALHNHATAAELRRQLEASGAATASDAALAVGDLAPAFEMPSVDGEMVTLDGLLGRGLPLVLVFASPICGPCRALIPELVNWNRSLSNSLTLVVVESTVPSVDGLAQDMPSRAELVTVHEPGIDVASAYRVHQTPTAIGIDRDGKIAAAPAIGGGAIEQLVRATLKPAPEAFTEAA